jgi:mono/diheme cytochrome c family protein
MMTSPPVDHSKMDLSKIDHGSKFFSPRRPSRVLVRNVAVSCSVLFAVALVCSLPQPATRVVQAYSRSSKQAGSVLFHEKGCEHCHGVDGQGGDLGPDLTTIGKRWKKQQIEQQVRDGGAAMPAFGKTLQPDEIKDLVDYLHAKRKAPKVRLAPSN